MTAQKGKDILLKIGDAASPEVFASIGGLRTKGLSFNGEAVDITNSDSASQWRELLAAGGVKSLSVSGAGVFKDDAQDAIIQTKFYAQTLDNWELTIPGFGTYTGAFLITAYEYGGEHNNEVTFTLTLESSGEPVFAAA